MTSSSPAEQPEYNVLTWDPERNDFTPQDGIPTPVTGFSGLRRAIKALRLEGYTAHRTAHDSDPSVLIERVSPSDHD